MWKKRERLNEWFTGVFGDTPLNVWSRPFVVFIIWSAFQQQQQQQRLEGEFSGNKLSDVTPSPVMLCLRGCCVAGHAVLGLEIILVSSSFSSGLKLKICLSRSPEKIPGTEGSSGCSWSPSDHRCVRLSPESLSDLLVWVCPGDLTARCVSSNWICTQMIPAGRNSFTGHERLNFSESLKSHVLFFFINRRSSWMRMSVLAGWRRGRVSGGPENFTSVFILVSSAAITCNLTVWAPDSDEQIDQSRHNSVCLRADNCSLQSS